MIFNYVFLKSFNFHCFKSLTHSLIKYVYLGIEQSGSCLKQIFVGCIRVAIGQEQKRE